MLRAHRNDVLPCLPGKEAERYDWMLDFKFCNLGFLPGVKASRRIRAYWSDALSRVVPAHLDRNRVLHERAQSFAQSIGAFGLVSASSHKADNVLALEQCSPLVAVSLALRVRLTTKLLNDVPPHALRTRFIPRYSSEL
jgi:hypothetical protein